MTGDDGLQAVRTALRTNDRTRRFLQYLLVGLVGVGVNEGVLYGVTGVLGLSYVIGGFAGRVVSILVNYAVNDAWTWGDRGEPGAREWVVRAGKYVVTRLVGIALGLAALVVFVEVLGIEYLVANVLAIGVGVLWGFGASDRWVWRTTDFGPNRGYVSRVAALLDAAASGRRWRPSLADRATPTTAVGRAVDRLDRHAASLRGDLDRVDRPTWAVLGLAGVLFVAFSVYTTLLFARFQLTGSDFGSYVHMFSTTLSGNGFLLQGKYRADHPSGVYWGAHFTLTLLLYLPLYALVPRPETLLVAKSFALAASVAMLWVLARDAVGDRLAALVVVSYAANPFLWSAWSFDFQEQSLLPLFVFAAYAAYQRGRDRRFLVGLALVLLTNEFTVPIVGGFLVGLGIRSTRLGTLRRDGPLVAAGLVLVAATYLLASAVIGVYSTGAGIPIRLLAVPVQRVIDGPVVSLGGVVLASVGHPDVLLQALATAWRSHLVYLLAFGLPVLYVGATDEATVGALLPFVGFAWLLAGKAAYYQFAAHYPFYLLPFLYVGTVFVLHRHRARVSDLFAPRVAAGRRSHIPDGRRVRAAADPTDRGRDPGFAARLDRLRPSRWLRPSRGLLLRAVLTVLVVNALTLLVIGGGNLKAVRPASDHDRAIERAFDAVPEDASVMTQNNLYPAVARRPNATFVASPYDFARYEREIGPIAPTYVVYDARVNRHWATIVRDAFGDRLGTEYGLYRYGDGVWVFERGYDGTGRWLGSGDPLPYYPNGTATFGPTDLAPGRAVPAGDYLSGTANRSGQRLWYGPYAILPAGDYTATVHVLVWGPSNRSALAVDVAAGDDHRVLGVETVPRATGWQTVTVPFTLDHVESHVEVRGTARTANVTVLLDRISVAPSSDRDADPDATTRGGSG